MKRIIALAVIAALGLTGCGASNTETETQVEEKTEEAEEEPTEPPKEEEIDEGLKETITTKLNELGIDDFEIKSAKSSTAECMVGDDKLIVYYGKSGSSWTINAVRDCDYKYYYSSNKHDTIYDYATGEVVTEGEEVVSTKKATPTPSVSETTTSKAGMIESDVRSHVRSEYADTDIDHITVNNDSIVLAYLVWNVKNSESTTKQMLRMYSDDLAATLVDDYDDLKEIAVFWNVPYLSKDYKWHYSCSSAGAYMDDSME